MATATAERGDIVRNQRPSVRDRLVPRTVLGLTVVILAASFGAAFSGAVLYAYYEYRLTQNEERVEAFVEGFDERFDNAVATIEAEREEAKSAIAQELEPLKQLRAEGDTLNQLLDKVKPSVWFVSTLDEAGQPSVGSAFVVASEGNRSLLLASYNTVRAATKNPGPNVVVRKGDEERRATVWTWQEERDLALLVIERGDQPRLTFAGDSPKTGERVFAVSGIGGSGAAITQGFVADVFGSGIQHDAAVGAAFQGGPLLNSKGEVVGVASRAYAPLGFSTEALFIAIPARLTCEEVLRCPGGDPSAAGARR